MIQIKEPKAEFMRYLEKHHIRWSKQRDQVLDVFLRHDGHMTMDDLHQHVREKYPEISYATVHRAMKLICDSGIGEGFNLGEKAMRYEHHFGHKKHDHLICESCEKIIELACDGIDQQHKKSIEKHRFNVTHHRLLIYGYCRECQNKQYGNNLAKTKKGLYDASRS